MAKDTFDGASSFVADRQLSLTWSAVQCFSGGCKRDATYSDQATLERLDEVLFGDTSSPIELWQGAKQRSAPVTLPDGRVLATRVLFPPDSEQVNQKGLKP